MRADGERGEIKPLFIGEGESLHGLARLAGRTPDGMCRIYRGSSVDCFRRSLAAKRALTPFRF